MLVLMIFTKVDTNMVLVFGVPSKDTIGVPLGNSYILPHFTLGSYKLVLLV